MTCNAKAKGRFGKQDFRYIADEDVYVCPAGNRLTYRFSRDEAGRTIRRYWTDFCSGCSLKDRCTSGKERRIGRWEHEDVLEAVQRRLDENPQAMRQRRETVEHPFGTIKMRLGATHFLMKRLKNVRTEMALSVLAYNLTRVINILGIAPLIPGDRPSSVFKTVRPARCQSDGLTNQKETGAVMTAARFAQTFSQRPRARKS